MTDGQGVSVLLHVMADVNCVQNICYSMLCVISISRYATLFGVSDCVRIHSDLRSLYCDFGAHMIWVSTCSPGRVFCCIRSYTNEGLRYTLVQLDIWPVACFKLGVRRVHRFLVYTPPLFSTLAQLYGTGCIFPSRQTESDLTTSWTHPWTGNTAPWPDHRLPAPRKNNASARTSADC